MRAQTHRNASAGAMLCEARLSMGLELRTVSERTRLSMQVLEAIESDDWEALGAPVYARGFVKLYAEVVTLDSKLPLALIDQVQAVSKEVEPSGMTPGVAVGSARRAAEVIVEHDGAKERLRIAGVLAVLAVLCLLGWLSFGAGLEEAPLTDEDMVLGVSPDNTEHTE